MVKEKKSENTKPLEFKKGGAWVLGGGRGGGGDRRADTCKAWVAQLVIYIYIKMSCIYIFAIILYYL
jgi:hypothetical protein